MATTQVVILTDSLDERIKSNVETVTFFDPNTGEKREIELGEANRTHFANHLEKLAKYIAASVVVETPKPAKSSAAKADTEVAKIRVWAQANGYAVGDRGRIKAEIKDAYYKAQGTDSMTDDEAKDLMARVKDYGLETVGPDGDTQVIDEPVTTKVDLLDEGTFASDNPPADLDETEPDDLDLSDEGILKMMADIEEAEGNVTFEDLERKVSEQ